MSNLRNERDALESFMRMQDEVARALGPRGGQGREHVSSRVWSPPVDVYEDPHAIVVRAEIPGMRQEEIDIEIAAEMLTIKGERKFDDEERRERYVRIERQYGAFQRSFTIGVPIDENKVRATYKNGVLEITLPKSEAVRPKKVQVAVE